MDKKRRSNQTSPIEIFKDILIVLLLCSAFFLLWEAQILVGLPNPLSTSSSLAGQTQDYQLQAEAARPIRMAAISGENGELYGVQYDNEAVDELFQLSSNILRETLGSLDSPVAISQYQWQTLLSTAPGLYLDMAGEVPLSVLSGWLSGQESLSLAATPQCLLLTTTTDGLVALAYQDENGDFYLSSTQVVDSSRLSAIVDQYPSNGAQFAFQSPGLSGIAPYTLLSNSTPTPNSYLVSNPIATDESRAILLELLQLDGYGSSIYTSTDGLGIVLRNDTATLRINGNGIVTYHGAAGQTLYTIASSSMFDVVDGCRNLVATVLVPFCDDARTHLLSVQETEQGWIVDFCYTLNGSPVQFSDGNIAAQFIVEDGEIIEFTLRLRSYTASDETAPLLPEQQAVAALSALGSETQPLILSYYDSGVSQIFADWATNNR